MNPKVSVVITCFNDGQYIEQAVASILSQTLQPDEILIVDDGSEYQTKKIITKLKNKKIQIITQKNQGLPTARNNGIAQAKGRYILPLDADDFFEPTFIEKAVKILDSNETIGIVSCGFRWFNEESPELRRIYTSNATLEDFLFANKCLSGSMFRKICWSKVGGYDESMKLGYEDWEFWISITSHGWKMEAIPEILYNYRRKEKSMFKKAKSSYDLSIRKYIFIKHKDLYALHIDKTLMYFFSLLESKSIKKEEMGLFAKMKRFVSYVMKSIKKIFFK